MEEMTNQQILIVGFIAIAVLAPIFGYVRYKGLTAMYAEHLQAIRGPRGSDDLSNPKPPIHREPQATPAPPPKRCTCCNCGESIVK